MKTLRIKNFSQETKNIISKIKLKQQKQNQTLTQHLESVSFHDNTSPGYEWLLPTWLA